MLVGRRTVRGLWPAAPPPARANYCLSVLALALGIAFGAVELFDVSCFCAGRVLRAGMVLNESELSHQAAHDTLRRFAQRAAVCFCFRVGNLFDPFSLDPTAAGGVGGNYHYRLW